jgi:di/tricarboxylate transporter
MTVTASPKDSDGAALSAKVTALTTAQAAVSSPLTKAALSAVLDQTQRELVYHYLDTGRLVAANILSTMT